MRKCINHSMKLHQNVMQLHLISLSFPLEQIFDDKFRSSFYLQKGKYQYFKAVKLCGVIAIHVLVVVVELFLYLFKVQLTHTPTICWCVIHFLLYFKSPRIP